MYQPWFYWYYYRWGPPQEILQNLDFFQNLKTSQTLHLGHFQASGPQNSDSTRHSGSNELGIIEIEALSVKIEDF